MWDRVTAGLSRVFRRAMPGHDEMGEDFFDYTTTTILTTYRAYARPYAASLIKGGVRRHPEGGARPGVRRQRFVTVCLGRPGPPPARHYDLAARSSLHGSEGNCLPL